MRLLAAQSFFFAFLCSEDGRRTTLSVQEVSHERELTEIQLINRFCFFFGFAVLFCVLCLGTHPASPRSHSHLNHLHTHRRLHWNSQEATGESVLSKAATFSHTHKEHLRPLLCTQSRKNEQKQQPKGKSSAAYRRIHTNTHSAPPIYSIQHSSQTVVVPLLRPSRLLPPAPSLPPDPPPIYSNDSN